MAQLRSAFQVLQPLTFAMRRTFFALLVFEAAALLSAAETPGTALKKSVDELRSLVLPPLEEELAAKEAHNRREIDRVFAFGGRRLMDVTALVELREALRSLNFAVQMLHTHESIYVAAAKKERHRAAALEFLEKQRQEFEPFKGRLQLAMLLVEKTKVKFDRNALPAIEERLSVALDEYARSIGIVPPAKTEANQ